MKRTIICHNMPKMLLFILIIGVVLTTGCGGGPEASSDQTGGISAEDQLEDQNQTDGDMEAIGLTNFKTKNIFGQEVNQDLFLDHKLTLVNVWGTFCGPCLEEMPYLGELQNEYESKGVNIVGIVVDVQNEELEILDDQIKLAREIAKKTGADYTHMIMSNDLIPLMNEFEAIPASFFVDSSGSIVSEYYIGSRSKEDWVKIIETNLEKHQ